jgi:hypothetical protein
LGAEEVSFHWSSALGAEEVRYEGDAVSSSLFMSSANYGVCLAKFPVCCKYVPDFLLRTLAVAMFLLRVFVVVLGCWHSFFVIVYNGNRSL